MIRQHTEAAVTLRAWLAALTMSLATITAGCGGASEGETVAPAGSMTEGQYIAHVAALTVAVGEGLTGEAAEARAVQLGSEGYSREEVEQFARTLRADPEHWLRIEQEIADRVNVMTRPEPPTPQGTRRPDGP